MPLVSRFAIGGPIVTFGAALLFYWMALVGERPAGWSYEGEPSKLILPRERVLWALAATCLVAYEIWKLHRFAMHPFQ